MTTGRAFGLTFILILINWGIHSVNTFVTFATSNDMIEMQHMLGIGSCLGTMLAYYILLQTKIKKERFYAPLAEVKKLRLSTLLLCFLLAASFYLCQRPLMELVHRLFLNQNELLIIGDSRSYEFEGASIHLIYYSIQALLILPLLEELFFRRTLFGGLLQKKKITLAVFVSALCFSAIHIYNPELIPGYFFMGILAAIVYHKTGKLGYAIGFHFFFNLCDFGMYYNGQAVDAYLVSQGMSVVSTFLLGAIVLGVSLWLLAKSKAKAVDSEPKSTL